MQQELMPLSALDLIAACRRLEAKITLYAPELTVQDLALILGELEIANGRLERLTAKIRQSPEWQRRMALPDSPASALVSLGLLDHTRARRWRSPKPIILYPKKKPAPVTS